MSGGVRNVFVENCKLDSPDLDQAIRFKTNAMRGGTIEHIFFRNITVGQVNNAVVQVDFQYEEGEKGPEKPVVPRHPHRWRHLQQKQIRPPVARLRSIPHPRNLPGRLHLQQRRPAECSRTRPQPESAKRTNQRQTLRGLMWGRIPKSCGGFPNPPLDAEVTAEPSNKPPPHAILII